MEMQGKAPISAISALEEINRLSHKKLGPPRSFSYGHLILALFYLFDRQEISRDKLAEELGLGGGAIKTLVITLRNSELIETKRNGNRLTEKGRDLVFGLHKYLFKLAILKLSYLNMGDYNAVALASSSMVGQVNPIKLRDIAVRKGATGMTTLVMHENEIVIPPDGIPLSHVSAEDNKKLLDIGPSSDEIIFICGANSEFLAKQIVVEVAVEAALQRRVKYAI
ncbi:MAG: DUF4443 domain-containing protein [Thermoprotei archaeon]